MGNCSSCFTLSFTLIWLPKNAWLTLHEATAAPFSHYNCIIEVVNAYRVGRVIVLESI
jgi:hypothetical protein